MTKTLSEVLEKMYEIRQGYLDLVAAEPASLGEVVTYDFGALAGMNRMIKVVENEIR